MSLSDRSYRRLLFMSDSGRGYSSYPIGFGYLSPISTGGRDPWFAVWSPSLLGSG